MHALEAGYRPGIRREPETIDMDAMARRALADAISAGADGIRSDEQFWRQVRRVLGGGFYDARVVSGECAIRFATCRNFADMLALRTLKEAADRRAQ